MMFKGLGTSLVQNITFSILSFVAAYLAKDHIKPWLSSVAYQGVCIEGEWTIDQIPTVWTDSGSCDISIDKLPTTTVQIVQQGPYLTGQAISTSKGQQRTYEVRGEIRDRIVRLQWNIADAKATSHSIFLLEVESDGRSMRGARAFFNSKDYRIQSKNERWQLALAGC